MLSDKHLTRIEHKRTNMQPIANFSEMAVRMAHDEVTTGTAPAVEKASIDCILVDASNVGNCGVFRCN